MVNWLKQKWKKLYRWYRRVFFNEFTTIKPSGTVSMFKGYGGGIEPYYTKGFYRELG